MFGTSHTYVLPGAGGAAAAAAAGAAAPLTDTERKLAEKKGKLTSAVEIALAPEELEGADAATLKRKYEQSLEASKAAAASNRVDVSDVVEEENRKKKRKIDKSDTGAKKKSTFKF